MTPWETGTNAPSDAQIDYAEDLIKKIDEAHLLGAERMKRRFMRAKTKRDLSNVIREANQMLDECNRGFSSEC